jgi:hypothetical protein
MQKNKAMDIAELLNNKNIKPKLKTETLSNWLLDKTISTDQLIQFATSSKDALKATCIEAIEFATKQQPDILNTTDFDFILLGLEAKAPRIKWESAKVIANTIHLFPEKIDLTIHRLLQNTEHIGTVVRWSAAMALGEIIKFKTTVNKNLIPAVDAILKREEKSSIKKIYLAALKKANISLQT